MGTVAPLWEESVERKLARRRFLLLGALVTGVFAVLLVRLFWLQVVQEEIFLNKAITQATRWIPEKASRGEIYDSMGNILVTNRPVYILTLNYLGLKNKDINSAIEILVQILDDPDITTDTVRSNIDAQSKRLYEPITIKRDLPLETVVRLEENRWRLPGILIETSPQRLYPYGGLMGHVLGYVHPIKEELDLPGYDNYGLGDLVGKTGIEKSYEFELKGQGGYREVTVNARNHPMKEISNVPSVIGNSLQLTVDIEAQQKLEQVFDGVMAEIARTNPKANAGAAVILNANTGGLLAMVSRPIMYPEDFNGNLLTQERADYYFNQQPAALINRAIQGTYVPGSTFKPVTGMAALASGNLKPDTRVTCGGAYWYKPYIKCTGTHGSLSFNQAMARSCNVYFQEAARRAGISNIGRIGHEFNLDAKTGLDLPFEGIGLLPSLSWQSVEFAKRADSINKDIDKKIADLENKYAPLIGKALSEQENRKLERELSSQRSALERWRRERLNEYTTWREADTYNTGIGQGYNQYTMIEMAAMVAAIANGGTYYTPYIVDKIYNPGGALISRREPSGRQVGIEPWILEATKKAMTAAAKPGGTAYGAFAGLPSGIGGGAKTGTAQPGRSGYVKNKDFDGLFICFAPAENPEIAFACVIEHGQSGSGSAGKVAKGMLEYYFIEKREKGEG